VATVAGGIARLPLYCSRAAAPGCFGSLTLTLARAGRERAAARQLLGAGRVAVPAGRRRTIRIRLRRGARRLVAGHRRVVAGATLALRGVAPERLRRTVLVRPAGGRGSH
jgi:hypothetical protein